MKINNALCYNLFRHNHRDHSMRTLNPHQATPQDFIAGRLLSALRDNIAPLGLRVDCLSLRHLSDKSGMICFNYKNLLDEIQIWGKYLKHKPLGVTLFKDPLVAFNAYALSEIVSAINENLHLLNSRREEHAAIIRLQHVTEHTFSLLKDLNFNHIKICLNASFNDRQAKHIVNLIEDFQFPYISLIVDIGISDLEFFSRLLKLSVSTQPETIVVNVSSKVDLERRDHYFAELFAQYGYSTCYPSAVVRHRSNLISPPQDNLCLGPNSCSIIGGYKITNHRNILDYSDCLRGSRLPIASIDSNVS